VIRPALFLVLLVAGCSAAAADHERLGDRAYREGRFSTAMAEYQAALKSGGKGRLWAKLGSAALAERDLAVAIEAYSQLGASDRSRGAEAAAGLERVARLAERAGEGEVVHLAAAVRALRSVAPGRPLGRFALRTGSGLPPNEALGVLPAALATAVDGRLVDSLLVAVGAAQRLTTDCEGALRTLKTVLRRTRDAGLRRGASQGLGACAVRLGLDALATDQAENAERWFDQGARAAGASPWGWRASIGVGDARIGQGDLLGAAIAFQSVISAPGAPDSLVKMATEKLNALGSAAPVPPEEVM
jgi:tetratricopeptide (TPR) repeat protein